MWEKERKSKNDIEKEQYERNRFNRAVELSQLRGGQTAEILSYLNGRPFEDRHKNDRPDLINVCIKGRNNSNKTLVGIEHFEVNQLSTELKRHMKSTGREIEAHMQRIYSKGHNELVENGHVSHDSIMDILNEIYLRNYNTFLRTFNTVLHNHYTAAEIYRKNLHDIAIAENTNVELAFLIEIRTVTPQLFLNKAGGRVDIKDDGLLPVTEDIVELLSAIDASLIDYIILFFCNADFRGNESIIAIRSGNIKKQLDAQGIETYIYASEELFANVEPVNNGEPAYRTTLTVEYEEPIEPILNALESAFHAQKNGKPFAASRSIQCLLYAVGEHIQQFEKRGEVFIPVLDDSCPRDEALKSKYDEFDRLYGKIGDRNEQIRRTD